MSNPDLRAEEAAVIVVGAGPVGATLALELAHRGIGCAVIERSPGPSPHPKMDFVNARSMELLDRLGVVGEIRRRGVPARHPFTFHWARSLAEPPVAVWESGSVDAIWDRIRQHNDGTSPAQPYQRLPGAVLEDVLRDAVRQRPAVRLYEGWTFEGLEQDADGVTALLKDHGGRPARLRAAYLVGCDGAASAVRSAAGIATTLRGPVTQHCDVYLRSADPALRRYGRFFLAILASGLTLVSRDEHDTWTATFPLPEDWPSGADPVAEVRRRLGVPIDIEEVINVAYWQGRLGVADRYRDGRVFLAGDSAHQFFPTGGHGANTGIADAVDLGWKLAGRLAGWAGPALLASYALERRPVALFNREMCANLLDVWRRFPALAGDGATDAQLAGFLEQDAYQIDNLGIHCGYRYDGSPVIWPEQGRPPAWRWREIVPATWPGARVPSLRLANGAGLHGRLGQGFTMVDFSTEKRGGAAVELASARGIPMDHLVLDDSLARRIWQRDLVLVRPDQHVAWRGDAASDWGAILDRVTGWAEGR